MDLIIPEDIADVGNPYTLLGVEHTATEKIIRKAYKRKALELHPDKNHDNPDAATNFAKLQKAFEFLQDNTKRGLFDANIRAYEGRKIKFQAMSAEKRKMREELDLKEKLGEGQAKGPPSQAAKIAHLRQQNESHMQAFLDRNTPTSATSERVPERVEENSLVYSLRADWKDGSLVSRHTLTYELHQFGVYKLEMGDTTATFCVPSRELLIKALIHAKENKRSLPFKLKQESILPNEKRQEMARQNKQEAPASNASLHAREGDLFARLLKKSKTS
eukprot:Platyproteum_vivax@DN612_c0_g1_i1.p1